MSRRIGILTFETPDTPHRTSYVFDIKNMMLLEWYARELSDWTRMNIVSLIWCNTADVNYNRDLARADRLTFTFIDPEQTLSVAISGSTKDGYTSESRAVCFFSQIPLTGGRPVTRRVGIPAPTFEFMDNLQGNGAALAHHLSQATGLLFNFMQGYLKKYQTEVFV